MATGRARPSSWRCHRPQTPNKVANPSNLRHAKRFLVITPGITIRDRLWVLQPNDPQNYYRLRGPLDPLAVM